MKMVGPAVKQPGVDIRNWKAPPVLGEDTENVLRGLLSLSEEEVIQYANNGVLKSYKVEKE